MTLGELLILGFLWFVISSIVSIIRMDLKCEKSLKSFLIEFGIVQLYIIGIMITAAIAFSIIKIVVWVLEHPVMQTRVF